MQAQRPILRPSCDANRQYAQSLGSSSSHTFRLGEFVRLCHVQCRLLFMTHPAWERHVWTLDTAHQLNTSRHQVGFGFAFVSGALISARPSISTTYDNMSRCRRISGNMASYLSFTLDVLPAPIITCVKERRHSGLDHYDNPTPSLYYICKQTCCICFKTFPPFHYGFCSLRLGAAPASRPQFTEPGVHCDAVGDQTSYQGFKTWSSPSGPAIRPSTNLVLFF